MQTIKSLLHRDRYSNSLKTDCNNYYIFQWSVYYILKKKKKKEDMDS